MKSVLIFATSGLVLYHKQWVMPQVAPAAPASGTERMLGGLLRAMLELASTATSGAVLRFIELGDTCVYLARQGDLFCGLLYERDIAPAHREATITFGRLLAERVLASFVDEFGSEVSGAYGHALSTYRGFSLRATAQVREVLRAAIAQRLPAVTPGLEAAYLLGDDGLTESFIVPIEATRAHGTLGGAAVDAMQVGADAPVFGPADLLAGALNVAAGRDDVNGSGSGHSRPGPRHVPIVGVPVPTLPLPTFSLRRSIAHSSRDASVVSRSQTQAGRLGAASLSVPAMSLPAPSQPDAGAPGLLTAAASAAAVAPLTAAASATSSSGSGSVAGLPLPAAAALGVEPASRTPAVLAAALQLPSRRHGPGDAVTVGGRQRSASLSLPVQGAGAGGSSRLAASAGDRFEAAVGGAVCSPEQTLPRRLSDLESTHTLRLPEEEAIAAAGPGPPGSHGAASASGGAGAAAVRAPRATVVAGEAAGASSRRVAGQAGFRYHSGAVRREGDALLLSADTRPFLAAASAMLATIGAGASASGLESADSIHTGAVAHPDSRAGSQHDSGGHAGGHGGGPGAPAAAFFPSSQAPSQASGSSGIHHHDVRHHDDSDRGRMHASGAAAQAAAQAAASPTRQPGPPASTSAAAATAAAADSVAPLSRLQTFSQASMTTGVGVRVLLFRLAGATLLLHVRPDVGEAAVRATAEPTIVVIQRALLLLQRLRRSGGDGSMPLGSGFGAGTALGPGMGLGLGLGLGGVAASAAGSGGGVLSGAAGGFLGGGSGSSGLAAALGISDPDLSFGWDSSF